MRAWATAAGDQLAPPSACGITPDPAQRFKVAGVTPTSAAACASVRRSSLIALEANNGGTSDVAPPLRGRVVPRRRPATQSSALQKTACASHYPACCQFQVSKCLAAPRRRQYPKGTEEIQAITRATV